MDPQMHQQEEDGPDVQYHDEDRRSKSSVACPKDFKGPAFGWRILDSEA